MTADARSRLQTKAGAARAAKPAGMAPIVPPGSIAGRALVAVVAIMCFLACLAVGAVTVVADAARSWQSDVLREVTIQVRPIDGADVERELARAADVARRTAGVASLRVLTRAENERLLRPWLGEEVGLEALPVPRLVVLEVDRERPPDLAALRAALERDVRGASLDDHRLWRDRLAAMTRAVVAVGMGVLALVLAATALSVVFATRGAMASNRGIVEVLHFVGAEDRFIAATFQRRFMRLGLEGGLVGGAAAIVAFHAAGLFVRSVSGAAGEAQLDLMFGSLSIGAGGYLGIVLTVLAVALVTAVTSRLAVRAYLAGERGSSG
jgi:cell division transport system permease protein